MEFEKAEFINDWDKWKGTLSRAINIGQAVGLSQESIEKISVKIGNFLESAIDPENREERVLKELWAVGDDADRKALAGMIIKMVQTGTKH